jgi:hypothetical protein
MSLNGLVAGPNGELSWIWLINVDTGRENTTQ